MRRTEDERTGLVGSIVGGGVAGAFLSLLFVLDMDQHRLFFAGAGLIIPGVVLALELWRRARAPRLSDSDDDPGNPKESLALFLAGSAIVLVFPALTMLSEAGMTFPSLGLSPEAMFEIFWFVAAAAAMGYWLILDRTGPPENSLEGELGDWKRDKDFAAMAAISMLIIGLLAVFA